MNTLLIPRKLQAIQTGARPSLLLPALLRHAGCAALFFLASALNGGAQAQTILNSLVYDNSVGYILDSDTTSGHNAIQAHANFTLVNSTDATTTPTTILQFQLINADTQNPHPIYNEGGASTNLNYTYNITI